MDHLLCALMANESWSSDGQTRHIKCVTNELFRLLSITFIARWQWQWVSLCARLYIFHCRLQP